MYETSRKQLPFKIGKAVGEPGDQDGGVCFSLNCRLGIQIQNRVGSRYACVKSVLETIGVIDGVQS